MRKGSAMLDLLIKCKNLIWEMSKTKLVTIFVILTTIPLSIVGIISFAQALSAIERKTIESNPDSRAVKPEHNVDTANGGKVYQDN